MNSRLVVLILVAGALALRIGLVWHLGNYHSVQTWEYGEIARNLVEGRGYLYQEYRSWMPPLYPVLLAGMIEVFDRYAFLALELSQAVFSALTGLLLYWLGCRVYGRGTGYVALGVMALYPPLAVKVAYVDPVTVETFLLVAAMLLLYRLEDGPTFPRAVMAGTVLGLGVLARPVLLVFVGGLGLAWLLLRRGDGRAWVGVLGGVALCLVPWTARNWAVHGTPVLVSTNGGFNFWIGNNPVATGEAYAQDGEPVWTKMPDELKARLSGLDEVEQDRLLYQEGVRFVREQPGRFLGLTLRRVGYFWWFRPGAGKGNMTYPAGWVSGYKVVYGLLLAIAAAGVFLSRRQWRQLSSLYVLFTSLTLVYAFFFVHTRYRLVLEPFLILFAAHFLYAISKTNTGARFRAACGLDDAGKRVHLSAR